MTKVEHYHTLWSFSPSLYDFSRAAREISLHQDLLCQRGGELVCVSSVTLLFCSGSYFSLYWRTLLLLLLFSEEPGSLPDWGHFSFILEGGCVAVGAGGRLFDSFVLCFSWKQKLQAISHPVNLKWRAVNFPVSQVGGGTSLLCVCIPSVIRFNVWCVNFSFSLLWERKYRLGGRRDTPLYMGCSCCFPCLRERLHKLFVASITHPPLSHAP